MSLYTTTQTFLCGQRRIFSHIYNELSMLNTFISTVPLRVFQQLSSFLALPGCVSRWTVQWSSGIIWQEVSTSTRSQVAEVSWSGNCSTPISWELSPALQRWAFHTSWTAQVFEHLLIHWPHQLTISCIQNLQYQVPLAGLWLWGL